MSILEIEEHQMKCKNCGRDDIDVDDVDGLCDNCYDFVSGHSSYDPAKPNPVLDAVQEAIWRNTGNDDDDYDNDDDDDDDESWW
jgi:hypothetical protein